MLCELLEGIGKELLVVCLESDDAMFSEKLFIDGQKPWTRQATALITTSGSWVRMDDPDLINLSFLKPAVQMRRDAPDKSDIR